VSAISRARARAFDRFAMEDLGIPGLVLMENAARGIADCLDAFEGSVAIACGPGNNGGDGFALARHLLVRGRTVRVHLVAPDHRFRADSDAGVNLAILRAMGTDVRNDIALHDVAIVVDALFGTGLDRALTEPYLGAVRALNAASARCVAIDIPSGLDADTGSVHGAAVHADATVTMVAPKLGFTCGEGPAHTGSVHIVDIGVPASFLYRIAD